MKTKESRFQVHDELTAPERSLPILKGALSGGGQLSNFLGVLAGAPAVLRAYARFRSELRHGSLPLKTQQRDRARASPSTRAASTRCRCSSARRARPGSASTRSRSHASSTRATSARPRCCATCARCSSRDGAPPMHFHEEAREAGWDDEQILEAVAHVALGTFTNLVTRAGDVPRDGSAEEGRVCCRPPERQRAMQARRGIP